MIPGLEYEAEPTHHHAAASPSAQSMSSVEMSPQTHGNDQYHLQQLHRRRPHGGSGYTNGSNNGRSHTNGGGGYDDSSDKYAKRKRNIKKLDIFPKTERDYTVRTERGGQLTAVGYVIMAILIFAEYMTWRGMNGESLEHIVVDTR